jgi:phosphatidylglycerophosphate synthase
VTVESWAAYAERWSALHGGYDPRQASVFVRGWLFGAYTVARTLSRLPVSPDAVTLLGLVLSAGVPLLARAGSGWPLAGVVLVLASALADTADGALALITGRVSRLGRVYDSVADRISEACWLVALVLLGAPGWLVAVCGGVAWLHEYVRARATVAGMAEIGVVTVGERPTRIIVVLFALAITGVVALVHGSLTGIAATVATGVWTALGLVALVQLVAAVRRALAT